MDGGLGIKGLTNWMEILYYDFLRLIPIVSFKFTDSQKVIISGLNF